MRNVKLLISLLALVVVGLVFSVSAFGDGGVGWSVSVVSRPSGVLAGGGGVLVVLVTNSGGVASGGGVSVVDELPAGLVLGSGGVVAEDVLGHEEGQAGANFSGGCSGTGSGGVSCFYGGVVVPGDSLVLRIPVRVASVGELEELGKRRVEEGLAAMACGAPAVAVGCVRDVVRVSGGGAVAQGVGEVPVVVYGSEGEARAATGFGVAPGGAGTALSSVQAGAHADLTTFYAFNTVSEEGATAGNLKNITDDLPAGFAGDLVEMPVCPTASFLGKVCPPDTQVGFTTLFLYEGGPSPVVELQPVYNLAPEAGYVARFGFNTNVEGLHYVGDVTVRAPGEEGDDEPYGLKTTFYDSTAGPVDVDGGSLTIWGVPASPVHDPLRWIPGKGKFGGPAEAAVEVPYLTNPTVCGSVPLEAQFRVTSWQRPEERENPFDPETESMGFGPLSGCDRLSMEPSLMAQATADSPFSASGFDLDTEIPQSYPDPDELVTPALAKEVVTLPKGMTVNPSSGAGLQACSEAQYREEEQPERSEEEKEAGHGCPKQSKLATVRIKTPVLEEEAVGSVFLAESAVRGNRVEAGRNPFDSLLALYLVARIKNRGVLVKAPGEVSLNETTGQLTTTFGPAPAFGSEPASPGLPPLPFTVAKFEFNQGANAPLVTPPTCGQYTTEAALTPWSTLQEGTSSPEGSALTPLIAPFSIFADCPSGNLLPFSPQVSAGTENPNAGAYAPLDLRISRQDGEQEITGFSTQLPPGLTGDLSGIPQCGEAEVQRAREQTGVEAEVSPACPAGSEIGRSIAEAGVGSVLVQTPGRIYLGGPYDGAPFSVVSVTSAHVGPFDLGTVVVHFPLQINPETAVVSIPASPSDRIPHIIKGVVIHVRNILVYVNRERFMLNPTSCEPFALSATVYGNGEASNVASVSDPFRVTACQALKFAPQFTASASGETSKAEGAGLSVKVVYPSERAQLGQAASANIAKTKVELPVQLPSRLTTLQKACTQAQFRANPTGADCPAPSRIGHAVVHTPILPVPLEGPAIFVSNGSEAFPNLVIVLEGDGVRIDLAGDTFISKSGITSTTFKAVPDDPFESFELTLPQGPYSALAANGNLCKPVKTVSVKERVALERRGHVVRRHGKVVYQTKTVRKTEATTLVMPTELVGQNGATFKQETQIAVSGCPKAKAAKKRSKRKGSRKAGK